MADDLTPTTDTLPPPRVLVVDDEDGIRSSLGTIFRKEGWEVELAASGEEALVAVRRWHPEIVLTDMVMPGMSGMELLRGVRAVEAEAEVIVMTAYGTVDSAVECMRSGAYDFITKPLKRHDVVKAVRRALEHRSLIAENRRLRDQIAQTRGAQGLISASPSMRVVLQTVQQAAPTDVTVLISGESGTGKEVLARRIHELSRRCDGPFVAVNCAALPESILESELFGHEKGAFTGATARRDGRFSRAEGGTLFLDEIGNLSPAVQVKLLRVLQDGTFDRVGGQETVTADTRIVAATNAELATEIAEGRFREDLYYRLNVVAIHVPPLRERVEDIPLLVQHYTAHFAGKHGRPVTGLTEAALVLLSTYRWPGNVRELVNTIERAVVLTRATLLTPDDLPSAITNQPVATSGGGAFSIPFGTPLEEIERIVLDETLRRTDGDKKLTARLLGITTRTIYRKLGEARGDED